MYCPTNDPGNRTASFVLKAGVALYDGFVGNEALLSERNWQEYSTILSGDIDRNDTHVNGIVTSTANIGGNNNYNVVKNNTVDANTIIDGFVITAGQATNRYGGAVYNASNNLTISNSTFSGNSGWEAGGAIFNNAYNLTVSNVSFSGNFATFSGGAINHQYGSLTSYNNRFSGNASTNLGGVIRIYMGSLTVRNNSFNGNKAGIRGAFYVQESSANVTNTLSWQNSSSIAQSGSSTVTIAHSLIQGCNPNGNWNTATCGSNGGGNLTDRDPLFVAPLPPLLHLAQLATCICCRTLPRSMLVLRSMIFHPPIWMAILASLGQRSILAHMSTIQGKGKITQSPDLQRQQPSSTVTFTSDSTRAGMRQIAWSRSRQWPPIRAGAAILAIRVCPPHS